MELNSPLVAIYGTGKLAGDLLRACRGSDIPVVAAISHNPARVGMDFGTCATGEPTGIPIDADIRAALARGPIHTLLYAGFSGETMLEICRDCVDLGIDFITASGFFHTRGDLDDTLARLNHEARQSGAHILGTGMNPGFVADILPALLSTAMPSPVRIDIFRVSDPTPWGPLPLREEANIGKLPDAQLSPVVPSHMTESVHLLADAIALKLDRIETKSSYPLAQEPRLVPGSEVSTGCIIGFNHRISGIVDDVPRLTFEWIARFPRNEAEVAEQNLNQIRVSGPRDLVAECKVTMPNNTYPGTAARMVKSVIPLRATPPGFRQADELPLTPSRDSDRPS